MTLQATVLVPTHDHGPMLLHSVGSALAQTVPDLEVLIVGDGVPEITRAVVAELMRQDERVRFFDNPKGPRHGEIHRHAALLEARGEVVCYLSDDDLWLPDHVETMGRLLADADFTHALPLVVETAGTLGGWTVDLSLPYFRELLLSGENRIPLSCGAHTLDMYRRLPFGWRTTPAETYTDLYMWQQFLAQPECRARSGTRPTVLHFPGTKRQDWSLEERLGELEHWGGNIADPTWRRRFKNDVLDHLVRQGARVEVNVPAGLKKRTDKLENIRARLENMEATTTWRLRNRLIGIPGVRALFRWVARALAGPANR